MTDSIIGCRVTMPERLTPNSGTVLAVGPPTGDDGFMLLVRLDVSHRLTNWHVDNTKQFIVVEVSP